MLGWFDPDARQQREERHKERRKGQRKEQHKERRNERREARRKRDLCLEKNDYHDWVKKGCYWVCSRCDEPQGGGHDYTIKDTDIKGNHVVCRLCGKSYKNADYPI